MITIKSKIHELQLRIPAFARKQILNTPAITGADGLDPRGVPSFHEVARVRLTSDVT